jgi:hypothetical protein
MVSKSRFLEQGRLRAVAKSSLAAQIDLGVVALEFDMMAKRKEGRNYS